MLKKPLRSWLVIYWWDLKSLLFQPPPPPFFPTTIPHNNPFWERLVVETNVSCNFLVSMC